ncbi:MAG: hypothetical protein ACLP01_06135 [Solirubrobacteraceae bacterium]
MTTDYGLDDLSDADGSIGGLNVTGTWIFTGPQLQAQITETREGVDAAGPVDVHAAGHSCDGVRFGELTPPALATHVRSALRLKATTSGRDSLSLLLARGVGPACPDPGGARQAAAFECRRMQRFSPALAGMTGERRARAVSMISRGRFRVGRRLWHPDGRVGSARV